MSLPAPSRSTHLWHVTRRSLHMVRAAGRAVGLVGRQWWRLRRAGKGDALRALGVALVQLCTDLGATFIKVGQIASTRGDLLPRPLIEALSTLRDQVPPFPFAQVRATIDADLGALETYFSAFEEAPVAAASVAQVHRAVWRATGETVAVKVRRPDILEKVALDRSILLFVARLLERLVPSLRIIDLQGAMRNF